MKRIAVVEDEVYNAGRTLQYASKRRVSCGAITELEDAVPAPGSPSS